MIITPHKPETERAVIGEIILDHTLLKKSLSEDDFYGDAPRRIFREMAKAHKKGLVPDLVFMAEHLSPEDLVFLNEAVTQTMSTTNFAQHAEHLKELAAKRKIQDLCLKTASRANEADLNELLLALRQGTGAVTNGLGAGELVSSVRLAADTFKAIEARAVNAGRLSGVPFGLAGLDRHTDGAQAGELTIIAGRPSTGKTAFALWAALTAARSGFPGAFFSLEMASLQLGIRIQAILSGVPMWRLRKGLGVDWGRVAEASEIMGTLPIDFRFQVRNLKDIVSAAIDAVESKGAKALYIDYLQLVRVDGAQNREREVSAISAELKALATGLKVPVIAISQLSRAPERRDDKRPGLADLRDSGSLEQDADLVIMLHRQDISSPNPPVEFLVNKGRNCGTGTFEGCFDGETQRFSEPREGREEREWTA